METKINPNFSFTAFKDPDNEKSNAVTYYFEVDENNKPIYLGDGSYGMVYRVSDRVDGNPPGEFAVKIFYKTDELEDRFDDELNFYEHIRGKISTLKLDENIDGLIEPKGGSKSFDKSKAFENYFNEAKFEISPYAIVMKCYDGSLKDILEVKIKEKDKVSKHTGYEALLECSFDQRIKAMYKFIISITNGLKYLYINNNAHLDIKPANIFYKKRGINFEVILADIGFFSGKDLERNGIDGSNTARSDKKRKQLLGSIHYRSPEQKYDIDRCQAKIKIDDKIKVIITDPKFKGSLIEVEDRLVFTKYFAEKKHIISSIKRSKDTEPFKVEIELNSEVDLKKKIEEEMKTQVVLLKMQRIRTDLFGIGAIAFDLLTCGSSPERFYEKISSQDYEKNSINNILDKYSDVMNQSNDETEFLYIFNSFVDKKKFANRKIVEFILKCMLYKAKGSFYHEYKIIGKKNDYEVIDNILKYFKSNFESEYADQIALNATLNPIVSQKKVVEAEKISEYKMSEYLQEISEIPFNNYSERLYHGMKSFEALIAFLENDILNPYIEVADKNSYFAELRPDILFMDDNYSLRINLLAYQNKSKFIEGLKSHNVQNKLNTKFSHFFVPQEVVNLRRKVKLINTGHSQNEFYYDFLDRSFHSDDFKKDDFIVSESSKTGVSNLFKISEVINAKPRKIIKIESTEENNNTIDEVSFDQNIFFYYRSIDSKYYMHMLALYLQHIFFANLGSNSKNLPRRIFSILYLDKVSPKKLKLKPIQILLDTQNLKDEREKQLAKIIYMIIQIFLGLILNDRIERDYSIDNINKLRKSFKSLKSEVIDYLSVGDADFNKASVKSVKKWNKEEKLDVIQFSNISDGQKFDLELEQIIDKFLIDPNEKNIIDKVADSLWSFKDRLTIFKKEQPISKGNESPTPSVLELSNTNVEEVNES